MATLAADKVRKFRELAPAIQFPSKASDITYRGAAVTRDSSGDFGPLVATDTFVGFTDAKADNASGAAGDILIEVFPEGEVQLAVTGVDDDNDVGTAVYATDDDTFTTTASGALAIGKVSQWVTSTTCWIKFQGAQVRSI